MQYEIAGTELSCPEAVRYCFILLVSYYQQSQSTPTAPRNKPPFTLHLSGVVQMLKTYDGSPQSCVSSGAGRASAEGGVLQLAHGTSVHWAGQQ